MAPEWVHCHFFVFYIVLKMVGLCLFHFCIPMLAGHHPLALGCFVCMGWTPKTRYLACWRTSFAAFLEGLWVWKVLQCDAGGIA